MRELTHGSVEVGLKPVLICVAGQDLSVVLIQNVSDSDVFVGGSEVSSNGDHRGLLIKPGQSHGVSVYPHDSTNVYAVTVKQDENDDDDSVSATVVFMTS